MLIEFIGCTGSGKSTLSTRAADLLAARGLRVRRLHTGRPALDLVALPWSVVFALEHRGFCAFAARVLAREGDSLPARVNLLRNVAKKMGLYRRLRGRDGGGHVLWDEGPLHAAHNLFVHLRRPPRPEDVAEFARRVPRPDLVVYVRAPVDLIVARTLARGGHRRPGADERAVRVFTEHARQTFEALAAADGIRARLVAVDNDTEGAAALEALSRRVAAHIAARLAA